MRLAGGSDHFRGRGVSIGQAGVCHSVSRVERDGPIEVRDRCGQPIRSELKFRVASLDVVLVGLGIVGRVAGELLLLLPGQFYRKRRDHLLRDGVFDVEYVGEVLVEGLSPQRVPVLYIEHLDGHPQVIAYLLHRAVEHRLDAQAASRLQWIGLASA